jgi:hypothetical protein
MEMADTKVKKKLEDEQKPEDKDFAHLVEEAEEENAEEQEEKDEKDVNETETDEPEDPETDPEDEEKEEEEEDDDPEKGEEEEEPEVAEPLDLEEPEKKKEMGEFDPEDLMNTEGEEKDEEFEQLPDATKDYIRKLQEENRQLKETKVPEKKKEDEELPDYMKLTNEQMVELADDDPAEYHKVNTQRITYGIKQEQKAEKEKTDEVKIIDENLGKMKKIANKIAVDMLKTANIDPKSATGILIRKNAAKLIKHPALKINESRFDGNLNAIGLAVLDLLPKLFKDKERQFAKKYGKIKDKRPTSLKSSQQRVDKGDKMKLGKGIRTTKNKYGTEDVEIDMD